jgi:hypothetical protein
VDCYPSPVRAGRRGRQESVDNELTCDFAAKEKIVVTVNYEKQGRPSSMAAIRLGGAWKIKERESQELQQQLHSYQRMHLDLQAQLKEKDAFLVQIQIEKAHLNDQNESLSSINKELSSETHYQKSIIAELSSTSTTKVAEAAQLKQELIATRAELETERSALLEKQEFVSVLIDKDESSQEEATELRDLLYKSHETTEELEEQLEERNRCFSLMETAKKQKDRHVCVLVKEKERLHRRVQDFQQHHPRERTPTKPESNRPQKWASPCSVASPLSAKKLPCRPLSPGSSETEQEAFLRNMVKKLKAMVQAQQSKEGELKSMIDKLKLEKANLISRYRNSGHVQTRRRRTETAETARA